MLADQRFWTFDTGSISVERFLRMGTYLNFIGSLKAEITFSEHTRRKSIWKLSVDLWPSNKSALRYVQILRWRVSVLDVGRLRYKRRTFL